MMTYRLFWGDLHSHCSISYGHGTVEQAIARAREQLDFCSITGHAFWPDMPTDRDRYAEIIDYHNAGFARLGRNWQTLLDKQAAACEPGQFVTFPSYEWHSLEYGDHNVYALGPELALQDAVDLPALRSVARDTGSIAIPHHIGYAAGYRGIDWQHYREEVSPFVEVFSLHGCSVSDAAGFPMLHDMGPRDAGSTAQAGWDFGHRFGIVGGTDHHAAYPGSHGDGRMGVFATELTCESLWEAFRARRVFAATGDRIDARLLLDGAWIGSEMTSSGTRQVRISVCAADALDRVDVIKNGRTLRRLFPEEPDEVQRSARYRLRVTWGWGRKDQPVCWEGCLRLSDGSISVVESCFSGQPIVAPQTQTGDAEIADDEDLPHEITEQSDRQCQWRSVTAGNPTMKHQTTQAISFELEATASSRIVVEINGHRFEHGVAELLHAGRCHYLRGWLSEAIRIGPLVPIAECRLNAEFSDEPEQEVDRYRLEVAQRNGQQAWLSPIWVQR